MVAGPRVSGSGAGGRDAQGSRGAVHTAIDLGELVFGAGKADVESFDVAEPAFAFGFGDAGDQVVADLDEPVALGRVGPEHGQRTQACSWMQGVPDARPQVPMETLRRST